MEADPLRPGPFEGLSFALPDLHAAMMWAAAHPNALLLVALDYPHIPEVIQVWPARSALPHWLIWRDCTGRLHVDDWFSGSFDLPCLTVRQALSFIGSKLEHGSGRRIESPAEDKKSSFGNPHPRGGDT